MDLQAKLLRVLEDRTVRRLGGAQDRAGGLPTDLLDQPGAGGGGARGTSAPGSLLPHQHGHRVVAAPARADRRHSPPRQVVSRALPRQARARRSRPSIRRPIGACSSYRLAGQCPRARARDRAGGAGGPRAGDQLADLPEPLQVDRRVAGRPSRSARARSRRSSACPSCGRSSPPAGTSRPRRTSWGSGARPRTRRCAGTASPSAAPERSPEDSAVRSDRQHRLPLRLRLAKSTS